MDYQFHILWLLNDGINILAIIIDAKKVFEFPMFILSWYCSIRSKFTIFSKKRRHKRHKAVSAEKSTYGKGKGT